ncbi:phosphotransferase [Motiliproteus sediminis]|uniref:phosphotransferase n=1 Tax=Motiliproteus sediminis TaxID=1468178 RepID=UPI001AF02145|nr:phosphotransferase [Motiliproteus sediminis]
MPPDQGFFDPSLPGLDRALDHDWMAAKIERWLQQSESPFRMQHCRLQRFRYRPGERLVCLYEIELLDPLSGGRWRHWISGLISADNTAEKRYRRGCREADGQPFRGFPSLQPCWLEASRMVLQHFPLDHRLPHLAELFRRLPEPLEQLYQRDSGVAELVVEHPQPVRYRPLISAVLSQRVRPLDANRGAPWQVFLKLRADDSGELRYRRQLQLAGMDERLGLSPVRPLGFIPELRLQVDAAVPGRSLEQRVCDGDLEITEWQHLGSSLAAFHTAPLALSARVGCDSWLSRAAAACELIRWALPALGEQLDALQQAQRQGCLQPLWQPCHGDLKPEHLYLNPGQEPRLWLIDLEELCSSDPGLDLALLLARLEWLQLTRSAPATDQAGVGAMVASYFERVPSGWWSRLGACYSFAALDMARYAVQHQVPQWQRCCEHFCRRSEAALQPGWCITEGGTGGGTMTTTLLSPSPQGGAIDG